MVISANKCTSDNGKLEQVSPICCVLVWVCCLGYSVEAWIRNKSTEDTLLWTWDYPYNETSSLWRKKMEFKNGMKESTSRSCRRHYSRGFHLLIEQASVVSYCLHYPRHWVLNSEQHREPNQGSELWLLGSTSDSNIFLLGVFCNIICVSNIILADNL